MSNKSAEAVINKADEEHKGLRDANEARKKAVLDKVVCMSPSVSLALGLIIVAVVYEAGRQDAIGSKTALVATPYNIKRAPAAYT